MTMAAGPSAITLEKHLPMASGIGGGSADAAATLRALARLFGAALPDAAEILRLGADVPVCLAGRPVRMGGIGEDLTPVTGLPALPAVLVNPGVDVPTPEVFRALESRDNPPMPAIPEALASIGDAVAWIAAQRNDLEPPARQIAPAITGALDALRSFDTCLLARMSGSGATCFGVFGTAAAAAAAAASLARRRPGWWIAPTTLG